MIGQDIQRHRKMVQDMADCAALVDPAQWTKARPARRFSDHEDAPTAADLSSESLKPCPAPDPRPPATPTEAERARLQRLRADLDIRAGDTEAALQRAGCGR